MFCPTCGSATTPGISFCNRCGAELKKKRTDSQVHESLIWAIVAVSVGGLALIIGLMAVMKNELHFDNQLILLMSLLSFLPLLAAETVFIRMLFKNSRYATRPEEDVNSTATLRGSTTRELGEAREAFLHEPAASVTEQTTRTLETVERKRGNS